MTRRCAAEFIGTFWLVLGGYGSAVLTLKFPEYGIGILGVALAFGLTVLMMAFGIGRFPATILVPYVVSQACGGLLAGGIVVGAADEGLFEGTPSRPASQEGLCCTCSGM